MAASVSTSWSSTRVEACPRTAIRSPGDAPGIAGGERASRCVDELPMRASCLISRWIVVADDQVPGNNMGIAKKQTAPWCFMSGASWAGIFQTCIRIPTVLPPRLYKPNQMDKRMIHPVSRARGMTNPVQKRRQLDSNLFKFSWTGKSVKSSYRAETIVCPRYSVGRVLDPFKQPAETATATAGSSWPGSARFGQQLR